MTVLEERFSLAAERTGQIPSEGALGNAFDGFFSENAEYLAVMAEEYEWIRKGSLRTADLEELKRHNEICFIDLLGKNYDTSYANPAWAAKCLGGEFGPLLSAVCAELHSLPAFVYEQDLESVVIRMELFLEIYQAFVCAKQEKDSLPERKEIQEIFYWFASDYAETMAEKSVADAVDWERDFARKIVEESDLSDLRYLFFYGEYIADDQWKMAQHLNSLSGETLQKIADAYTEGFRKGFEVAGKPLEKKKSVNIRYPVGFERMVKLAMENFRKMGLEPILYRAPSSFLEGRSVYKNGYFGAAVNRQFDYDHDDDQALFLDKKFVHRKLECRKNAWETYREKAALHAGPAVIECFGEQPFEPVGKPEKL